MNQKQRWLFIPTTLILVSGCNQSSPETKNFFNRVQKELFRLLQSPPSEAPQPLASPVPGETPSGSDGDFSSEAARNAKANAEIMKEMLLVISNREPKDRSEFGNWVDTLNQGASLEGVYNGLTHSTDYRKLEASNVGASAEALKTFGEELALLEVELSVPTEFDSLSASPLPVLTNPDGDSPTQVIEFPRKSVIPAPEASGPSQAASSVKTLQDKYIKQFVGASIFTLKRVLGDEALKVISAKNEIREKLASWYTKWVVRVAQRNVDFGVPLRNKPDEAFHYKWALQSTEDRLKWEVLNRVHRILNEANKQKQ